MAIVGAGIGGLALAHALHRHGARITIVEQSDVLSEVGAGLSIWENGLQALEAIGLRKPTEALGRPWPTYDIHRPAKPVVTRNNLVFSSNSDVAPIVMKRGALFGVLKDALPAEIDVIPSFRLNRIEDRQLIADDGRTVSADIIVGADGAHSQVRKHLTDAAPEFCKQVCFRGMAHISEADPIKPAEIFDARDHRFGCFPLPGNEVYWFDIVDSEDPSAPFETFREAIKDLSPITSRLVADTPVETIIASPIEDMPPVTILHEYIALLGDAAHPMQPSLGQGACIALEDAIVLADCLALHPDDPAKGIGMYVSKRKKRWKQFFRMCRQFGTGALEKGLWARKLAIAQMVHTPDWMASTIARKIFAFKR